MGLRKTAVRERLSRSAGGEMPLGGLGLGMWTAFAVLGAHRSGACTLAAGVAGWKPFVAGVFAGLALCSVLVALFCAKDAFDADGGYGAEGSSGPRGCARRALPALAGATLSLVGTLGAWWGVPAGLLDASVDVVGLPWGIGGVLAGVGLVLLALPYARAYARMPVRRALGALAIALVTALVCDIVALALPSGAVPAVAVVEAVGAAGLACAIAGPGAPVASGTAPSSEGGCAVPEKRGADVGKPPTAALGVSPVTPPADSAARRIAALARRAWKPAVGAVICMFIFGFTWDTDALGVQLNATAPMAAEKLVGFAFAGVFLGVLARYRGTRDAQAILLTAVLPVMVVSFILRPYFLSSQLGPGALMVIGVARETGFALFLAAAWLSLTEAARVCRVSPSFAAAALTGLCGLAALLGLYWLHVLGSIVNYVGAILFTVYLVTVLIATAASGRSAAVVSDDRLKAVEQQGFERFLETRCEEIAEACGLTPRERDIVLHLGRGHSYAYIAGALGVSENTVRTHVRNLYRKLGISSREELLEVVHGER